MKYYCKNCKNYVGDGDGPPRVCIFCDHSEFISEDEKLGRSQDGLPKPREPQQIIAPPKISLGTCVNHPSKEAVHKCMSCGAPVCDVCAFVFQDDIYYCPACASGPKRKASPKKVKLAIATLVCIALGFVLFISAILGVMNGDISEEVAGGMSSLWFFMSLAALIMGLLSYDGNRKNPVTIWAAYVLGILNFILVILMTIIGLMLE